MTQRFPPAAGLAAATTIQAGRPRSAKPLMRRYEVAWLSASGDILEFSRIAPALPAFEQAFTAFGRGAVLRTVDGPRAVEDLLPGDVLLTDQSGPQPLRWIGSVTLVPDAPGQAPEMGHLTRITENSFGPQRPTPDLVLGPCARILHHAPRLEARIGSARAFAPARLFIDGQSVIEITPQTPVQVFHIAVDAHDSVTANGLAVETFHPGRLSELHVPDDLVPLYLSLFPQIARFGDFGAMSFPRVDDPRFIAA